MSTPTVYKSLRVATDSIARCPRAGCSVCGSDHRHHWYLDFDENHLDDLDDDEDGTEEEGQESEPFVLTPEGAQACICKHCDVRVFVSINARDLCEF